MNTQTRRRVMGGKSYPVVDIIHPDAIHIVTTAGYPANKTVATGNFAQYGFSKVIMDGEVIEDHGTVCTINNDLKLVKGGAHEYFFYPKQSWGSAFHWWDTSSYVTIYRWPRKSAVVIQGSPYMPLIICTSANQKFNNLYSTPKEVYVPVGSGEMYKAYTPNITEVKYNFIEDEQ